MYVRVNRRLETLRKLGAKWSLNREEDIRGAEIWEGIQKGLHRIVKRDNFINRRRLISFTDPPEPGTPIIDHYLKKMEHLIYSEMDQLEPKEGIKQLVFQLYLATIKDQSVQKFIQMKKKKEKKG